MESVQRGGAAPVKAREGPKARGPKAAEFLRAYEPLPGGDYAWVAAFAQKAYEDATQSMIRLDQKAEKLIGFTSAITAGTLAVLAKTAADGSPTVALWASPALLAAFVAVALAMAALWPRERTAPPTIAVALQYADWCAEQKRDVNAQWAAELHRCRECQTDANEVKAAIVKRAYYSAGLALMLLVLPLAAALGALAVATRS